MKKLRLFGAVCACATTLVLSDVSLADVVSSSSWSGAGETTLSFDEAGVPFGVEVTDQYAPFGASFLANDINFLSQGDASSYGLTTIENEFLRVNDWAFSIDGLQFDINFTEIQSTAVFNMEQAYGHAVISSLLNGEIVETFTMFTSYGSGLFYGFENSEFDQIHVTLQGAGGDAFIDNMQYTGLAPVPVPAAVWLFGSGLMGLLGTSRRKKAL